MFRLSRYHFVNLCLVWALCISTSVLFADDKDVRIAAGKKFLNDSRVDQWQRVFTEGVCQFGKVSVKLKKNGRLISENWRSSDFSLSRRYERKSETLISICNPQYSAYVITEQNRHRIEGVYPAVPADIVDVTALPFSIGSSVNFSRLSIPIELKKGNLRISDYYFEDNLHKVNLEVVNDPNNPRHRGVSDGPIELTFDDDIPTLLPVETIFDKGSKYSRHILSSDFREVAGYSIPFQVSEKNVEQTVIMDIFPEDRLNPEHCWLTYYGLPEPDTQKLANFGSEGISSWKILLLVAAVALVSCSGYAVFRRFSDSKR